LVKTNLTEHIPCGFIIEREKYIDEKCPRCKEILTENQYRNMGRWYVCGNCKEKFEDPDLELKCRKCKGSFNVEESKVLEIPKYVLNATKKNEIMQNVASFKGITKFLKDFNFHVELSGIVVGQKSGMKHQFSLIAKKEVQGEEIILALDHAVSENEVQSSPMILFVYKNSEIKVDIPVFIAIPKLGEKAKKIAQGHKFLLIEGSPESQETIDKIKNEIDLRILQKTQSKNKSQLQENENIASQESFRTIEFKSEIKPQLFSRVSSVHQSQKSTKTKKFSRFMNGLKRTTKGISLSKKEDS
jgi:predicted RNA-binding Zn-ribbon protein involved in translation (DUF1610 family)